MSAVTHKFNVYLTEEQVAQIRKEWEAHGSYGGAMLAQPVGVNGAATLLAPVITFAVLTPECSTEVCDVIRRHAEEEP